MARNDSYSGGSTLVPFSWFGKGKATGGRLKKNKKTLLWKKIRDEAAAALSRRVRMQRKD